MITKENWREKFDEKFEVAREQNDRWNEREDEVIEFIDEIIQAFCIDPIDNKLKLETRPTTPKSKEE